MRKLNMEDCKYFQLGFDTTCNQVSCHWALCNVGVLLPTNSINSRKCLAITFLEVLGIGNILPEMFL